MNKIIEGVKDAVKVAQCDHDVVSDGVPLGHLCRTRCEKCGARFWTPSTTPALTSNGPVHKSTTP